jgi:hypothetical protein
MGAWEVQKEAPQETPPQTGSPDDVLNTNGKLQVIEGSPYLLEQEEQKARQKTRSGWTGINLLLGAMVLVTWATLFLILDVPCLSTLGLAAGVGCAAAALAPFLATVWLNAEQRNFAAGRRGEEATVILFQEHLDGRWTLFRNVRLPNGHGDIDAVLTGPNGVYALEVKTYNGSYRNVGDRWQWCHRSLWRNASRNPGRQARRNATHLHDYLQQQGVEIWIQPRVVWAGQGELWLEKPAVRVWQLAEPDYILNDIEHGKHVPADVLSGLNAVLMDTRA